MINLITNPFERRATSSHSHTTISCRIINESSIVFNSYNHLHDTVYVAGKSISRPKCRCSPIAATGQYRYHTCISPERKWLNVVAAAANDRAFPDDDSNAGQARYTLPVDMACEHLRAVFTGVKQ